MCPFDTDKGEGVKRSKNLADVICTCPLQRGGGLVPALDGPRGAAGPLSPDEQEAAPEADGGGPVKDGKRHVGCKRNLHSYPTG